MHALVYTYVALLMHHIIMSNFDKLHLSQTERTNCISSIKLIHEGGVDTVELGITLSVCVYVF